MQLLKSSCVTLSHHPPFRLQWKSLSWVRPSFCVCAPGWVCVFVDSEGMQAKQKAAERVIHTPTCFSLLTRSRINIDFLDWRYHPCWVNTHLARNGDRRQNAAPAQSAACAHLQSSAERLQAQQTAPRQGSWHFQSDLPKSPQHVESRRLYCGVHVTKTLFSVMTHKERSCGSFLSLLVRDVFFFIAFSIYKNRIVTRVDMVTRKRNLVTLLIYWL